MKKLQKTTNKKTKTTQRSGLELRFNLTAYSGIVWGFIHAGVEQTANALRTEFGAKRWVKNICGKTLKSEGDYFTPYKIAGNEWTNLVDFLQVGEKHLSPTFVKALSKKLNKRTIFAVHENTSGVFLYELYDKGQIAESLHWGGAEKSRLVQSPGMVWEGFTFYSKLRKIKAAELTSKTVVRFFDSFLKSQGAYLVLETGSTRNGKFSFVPESLEPCDIERADYVGMLDEDEMRIQMESQKGKSTFAKAVDECLHAYFWAFKARDEYKGMSSLRPTLGVCAENERKFQTLLPKIKKLLAGDVDPDGKWLRAAVRNGNEPLLDLMLNSGYYSAVPDVLQEAGDYAIENDQPSFAVKISSSIANGKNLQTQH